MFDPYILIGTLALAAQGPEPATADPLDAFGQVCIDGEATFAPGAIERAEPADVPHQARRAAMMSIWLEKYDSQRNRAVKVDDMSDSAFRLNSQSEAYLTPPSSDPANFVQASCILWAEDLDFVAVSNFLAEKAGRDALDINRSTAAITYEIGDYVLKAGRIESWTIISASPADATALTETN